MNLTRIQKIALGIAGVSSVYAVVDGVLLRPLPYPDANRLVEVGAPMDRIVAAGR